MRLRDPNCLLDNIRLLDSHVGHLQNYRPEHLTILQAEFLVIHLDSDGPVGGFHVINLQTAKLCTQSAFTPIAVKTYQQEICLQNCQVFHSIILQSRYMPYSERNRNAKQPNTVNTVEEKEEEEEEEELIKITHPGGAARLPLDEGD